MMMMKMGKEDDARLRHFGHRAVETERRDNDYKGERRGTLKELKGSGSRIKSFKTFTVAT